MNVVPKHWLLDFGKRITGGSLFGQLAPVDFTFGLQNPEEKVFPKLGKRTHGENFRGKLFPRGRSQGIFLSPQGEEDVGFGTWVSGFFWEISTFGVWNKQEKCPFKGGRHNPFRVGGHPHIWVAISLPGGGCG